MSSSTTLSLRDRQRAQVRADITRAAMRLFAERGFDDVTTDEIAAEAGVSQSTYFRHVTSKEDLLLDPVRRGGSAMVQYLRERPAEEQAATALSEAILARSAAFGSEPESVGDWRKAILSAPHLLDRVALVGRDHREHMTEVVADRMTPQGDKRRAGLLVHVLLATAEYAFMQWLRGPEDDGTGLHESTAQALNEVNSGIWQ